MRSDTCSFEQAPFRMTRILMPYLYSSSNWSFIVPNQVKQDLS